MPVEAPTQREVQIYRQYQEIICGYIAELEVRDTEYPIEVFNEVRAIFTHLSRFKLGGKESNLDAAEKHVKRAILDCFKYMCISYAEEITKFRFEYRKVNLGVADNGKFLPNLDKLERDAKAAYIKAKKAEVKGVISDADLYSLYEDAYNKYKELFDFYEKSHEAILFASNSSKKSNLVNIISIIVTLISIAVAIGFSL